ncbi:NADH dehydrogenase [ubiquinone] 1 alpha subcomplex subunit 4-like 2 [Orchesella cincta]|uniref:NADH dehydrogenase [ubiquinone] 1 alpha subcomplex subunit 4-like 2 n=1 Tax=Orchesella cincta TaxID=48709 RepID=A0A1D2MTP1_ORCCI|nr:NADH dehydrogenase [ubiquinone] 1 alpha subcomplex subunit 4-like 2 [Orchesella cincta]
MGLKNIGLSGLTWSSIKKNPAILPIYGLVGVAMVLAGGYIFRLATKNPEVTWSRARNPEPWNEYKDKQYKFLATRDYSEGSPAPDYKK